MANDKSERRKKTTRKIVKLLIFIIILLLYYVYEIKFSDTYVSTNETQTNTIEQENESYYQSNVGASQGELILTMINVGQADCFLLNQNGKTALVDCGEIDTVEQAVEYLKKIGITKLDYVIGTHPHSDHMGGMYKIITNFEVGKIIIPDKDVTTNWYKVLKSELEKVYYSGEYSEDVSETELGKAYYDVENPEVGDVYELGLATIEVIGPMEEEYSAINNYSIVLKVTFGEMDIIMTGDAESKSEREILKSNQDLDAEILKLGHHGSDTSSCDAWLDAISPKYALISAGLGNIHEHPTQSVMEELEERDIKVYRTDESGTVRVIITSDDVSFSCEPGSYLSGIELEEKENAK